MKEKNDKRMNYDIKDNERTLKNGRENKRKNKR